ncbi:metabolite traffic protein EboE [Aquipuribacter sp. SD81]|uniref:metabolite traffic protein EboE n=1 Tax=Aquipuribacter sp. SD81 TaxID=3127703 RepID=UPI00301B1370
MRLTRPDGTTVHVSYCTNVHPATDLDGIVEQLRVHAAPVRELLGVPVLGVGLWFPAAVAAALAEDAAAGGRAVADLRGEVERLGLEVVTLNAFPYGDFHGQADKKAVYRPDWTEPARLAHTVACARLLAALLPADVAAGPGGTVSTLPLAWREPWDAARAALAGDALAGLAAALDDLAQDGPRVRVGLEPEPGCVWEVLDDALDSTHGLAALLDGRDPGGHVGVCLDTCHSAVGFDDLADARDRLAVAGVDVVKLQASASLHVDAPGDEASRAAVGAFAEPRFLHQTRELAADGRVLAVDDLPEALTALPGHGPWRSHVHAPLHADWDGPVRPETGPLRAALAGLVVPGVVDVVEVETYTWSVLPAQQRDAAGGSLLAAGLAAELAWVRDRLTRPASTAPTDQLPEEAP